MTLFYDTFLSRLLITPSYAAIKVNDAIKKIKGPMVAWNKPNGCMEQTPWWHGANPMVAWNKRGRFPADVISPKQPFDGAGHPVFSQ